MKRTLALALALSLALSACGGEKKTTDKTPQELAQAYTQAITAARSAEENEAYPVTTDPQDELTGMMLTLLGVTPEDLTAFAIAMSLRNVQAYTVAVLMPAEGKEDTVREGVENYVDAQKQSFERYLEDQYEIAASAKVETLDDGAIALVMCEGQDDVLAALKTALAA